MPYVLVSVCLLALVTPAAWWSVRLLLQAVGELDRLSFSLTVEATEGLESAFELLRSTTADFGRLDYGGSCST